jgi:hypothetical protein
MNYKTPVKSAFFDIKLKTFRETTFQRKRRRRTKEEKRCVSIKIKVVLFQSNFHSKGKKKKARNWIGKNYGYNGIEIYCSRYSFFILLFREKREKL